MSTMQAPTHVIDPDGEVIIILEDANAPFAVGDEQKDAGADKDEVMDEGTKEPAQDPTKQQPDTDADSKKKEAIRIQVSAKHLMLASPVLKKMLSGNWKESVLFFEKGSIELTVYSWDLEALLIVLNIMNCQNDNVPETISLELLAKVAVITDYYGCKTAVSFCARSWICSFRNKVLTSPPRDVALWMWIAWFFQMPTEFKQVTSAAMKHSQDRITHFGLPIPTQVIDALNERREKGIHNILANLQQKRKDVISGELGCGFECSSIMFGALEKHMRSEALLAPEPIAPYPGLQYAKLENAVRQWKNPKW